MLAEDNETPEQVHTVCFSPRSRVTVVQHFTDNFVTFNGGNFHTDQTIVNQYGVANEQVSSETFIRYRNHFAVADNRFISGESKGHDQLSEKRRFTAFQFHGADFRTFGIKQDSGGFTSFAHHVAQILNALTVFCIVTMREVQTRITFMPASSILANISSDSVFGPMVQNKFWSFFMTVFSRKLRRMGETCFLGHAESDPVLRKWWCPRSKDR